MEVSHVRDHITHAVIGGSQTIDFGISNSAEFFNILSSTLYKDQILAVVRETLCNAWDAHIEAGIQHVPVQITLTETKLIIRDFGTGIHRDDMGIVYGTYGNSTKKNDGRQTGGFGLGCKAPFAYTDHFEVISHHDGVKTIYNLSKSSAEVMGKPGMIPIASFPTEETGLQISIVIKNLQDYRRFFTLIARIVHNGDMHMTRNGNELSKLNFDLQQSNYLILYEARLLDVPSPIMVRYGNVIYPVDSTNELKEQYAQIQAHLKKLDKQYYNDTGRYSIVFQAPPHSISVQPSREGLSMQEHTINTLKGLFAGFLKTIHTNFDNTCMKLSQDRITTAVKEVRIAELLSTKRCLPGKAEDHKTHQRIADLQTMAKQYLQQTYPGSLAFRKQDITCRLQNMAAAGLLKRGLVQTYLRAMEDLTEADYSRSFEKKHGWLHRQILGPLLSKLQAAQLNPKQLFAFDDHYRTSVNSRCASNDLIPITEFTGSLFGSLPYLRNIVVVSPSIKKSVENMLRHEVFNRLGNYSGFLFYHTGAKKADKEAAVDFFTKTGMVVVDLTQPQPWDTTVETVLAKPRKPAKKGLPLLSCVLHKGEFDTRRLLDDDAARTETPEFVLNISLRKDKDFTEFPRWNTTSSRAIVELFGDKGAITNSTVAADKWKMKGAKDFNTYVNEKLVAHLSTSTNIQQYWAYCPKRTIEKLDYPYLASLMRAIFTTPALQQKFGLINPLDDIDQRYLVLWEYQANFHRYHHDPELGKIHKTMESIPLAAACTKLIQQFNNSPMLKLINADTLASHLRQHKTGPEADRAIELLLTVLK